MQTSGWCIIIFGLHFGFNSGKVAPSNVQGTFTPSHVSQMAGATSIINGVLTAGKLPITITAVTVTPTWAVTKPALTLPLVITAGATAPIVLELKPLLAHAGAGSISVKVVGTAGGKPFTQNMTIGYIVKDPSKSYILNGLKHIVNNGMAVIK